MVKVQIRWKSDPNTLREILDAYDHLIDNGWIKPPIRTVLYQLMGEYPDKWEKKHYDRLTTYLQECRDDGSIEYGMFSSDSGGNDEIPLTKSRIQEQIQIWSEATPLELSPDGNLWLIFHEHEGMTATLSALFDYRLGAFSSQGQIRHEHLYKVLTQVDDALKELNGNRIKVIGIADYDIYGAKGFHNGQGHILRNHKNWLERVFPSVDFVLYGITEQQIRGVGLDPNDEHQFDGWLQRYGLNQFERDIRKMTGLESGE